MDRSIVYPGSIPLDTDLLNVNRDAMIALGALIAATLGTAAVVDGLVVVPTSPATAAVVVGPGSFSQPASIDYGAYGTLPANAAPLMKMGIFTGYLPLACPAPVLPGQSIAYLIEAAFAESDTASIVLPYYNATNPAQPFLGPSGSGGAQPTRRLQQIVIQARAGSPAPTGSQSAPAPDANAIGLAVVTVATGQTMVRFGDIVAVPTAAMTQFKLPSLRPGFASVAAFSVSGGFTVPPGVTRAKITVTGGGGAGGHHATLPGSGGGSGGVATAWIGALVPGSVIPVTVGQGGAAAAAPGNGGNGGNSGFGAFATATGGFGGQGGSGAGTPAGGAPGQGVTGDVSTGGAYGTDAIPSANRGGDGGGPGAGRGSSGSVSGISALGYGGGGGGGAPGQAGGAGAGGLVTVEY